MDLTLSSAVPYLQSVAVIPVVNRKSSFVNPPDAPTDVFPDVSPDAHLLGCQLLPFITSAQADMDLPEAHTHSFVIKIWLEENPQEASQALWRGHITHVPSGTRRYFQDLTVIADFMQPYLQIPTSDRLNN